TAGETWITFAGLSVLRSHRRITPALVTAASVRLSGPMATCCRLRPLCSLGMHSRSRSCWPVAALQTRTILVETKVPASCVPSGLNASDETVAPGSGDTEYSAVPVLGSQKRTVLRSASLAASRPAELNASADTPNWLSRSCGGGGVLGIIGCSSKQPPFSPRLPVARILPSNEKASGRLSPSAAGKLSLRSRPSMDH